MPIFDLLLPLQKNLGHLIVSATDVSTNLFRLLPPNLAIVDIQSFNHVGSFVFSHRLIDHLRDPNVKLESLKTLTVHDAAEGWKEEDVSALGKACEARGIRFLFYPDDEMSEE